MDYDEMLDDAHRKIHEIATWNDQSDAEVLAEIVNNAYESMLEWKASEGVPLDDTGAGRARAEMTEAIDNNEIVEG